jgi:hypothetical protein
VIDAGHEVVADAPGHCILTLHRGGGCTVGRMAITVLHVPDCPNHRLLRARLAEALDRLGRPVPVDERAVVTAEDAAASGFAGSPTLLVDGRDPFPTSGPGGLVCRLYPTPSGPQGAPTVDDLVEVLRQ